MSKEFVEYIKRLEADNAMLRAENASLRALSSSILQVTDEEEDFWEEADRRVERIDRDKVAQAKHVKGCKCGKCLSAG